MKPLLAWTLGPVLFEAIGESSKSMQIAQMARFKKRLDRIDRPVLTRTFEGHVTHLHLLTGTRRSAIPCPLPLSRLFVPLMDKLSRVNHAARLNSTYLPGTAPSESGLDVSQLADDH